jgi:hypothetical protein
MWGEQLRAFWHAPQSTAHGRSVRWRERKRTGTPVVVGNISTLSEYFSHDPCHMPPGSTSLSLSSFVSLLLLLYFFLSYLFYFLYFPSLFSFKLSFCVVLRICITFDADPDPACEFDPDPPFLFNPDPTFHFDSDPSFQIYSKPWKSTQIGSYYLHFCLVICKKNWCTLGSGSSLSFWCGSGSYLLVLCGSESVTLASQPFFTSIFFLAYFANLYLSCEIQLDRFQ